MATYQSHTNLCSTGRWVLLSAMPLLRASTDNDANVVYCSSNVYSYKATRQKDEMDWCAVTNSVNMNQLKNTHMMSSTVTVVILFGSNQ